MNRNGGMQRPFFFFPNKNLCAAATILLTGDKLCRSVARGRGRFTGSRMRTSHTGHKPRQGKPRQAPFPFWRVLGRRLAAQLCSRQRQQNTIPPPLRRSHPRAPLLAGRRGQHRERPLLTQQHTKQVVTVTSSYFVLPPRLIPGSASPPSSLVENSAAISPRQPPLND